MRVFFDWLNMLRNGHLPILQITSSLFPYLRRGILVSPKDIPFISLIIIKIPILGYSWVVTSIKLPESLSYYVITSIYLFFLRSNRKKVYLEIIFFSDLGCGGWMNRCNILSTCDGRINLILVELLSS